MDSVFISIGINNGLEGCLAQFFEACILLVAGYCLCMHAKKVTNLGSRAMGLSE